LLTGLEYENVVTALDLALAAQVSILNPYFALSRYLDTTQDQFRGLQLAQRVLDHLETYPTDKGASPLCFEFAYLIGDIALWQLRLKHYIEAETSFQKLLQLLNQLEHLDEKECRRLKAGSYHHLGVVAEEQRQFTQAEQYYQQALQLFIDSNDRHSQAFIYNNFGVLAEEQRQWNKARTYFLQALEIYVSYQDTYKGSVVLSSLARLWQASGDASLPAAIASIVGITPAEVEELLRGILQDKPGQSGS
jgi:tetratricopeptide (TPR) repeat protein